MIGTAVTFHYLNRMVSAVLSETFLPRLPWLKESMKRMLGWALCRFRSYSLSRFVLGAFARGGTTP